MMENFSISEMSVLKPLVLQSEGEKNGKTFDFVVSVLKLSVVLVGDKITETLAHQQILCLYNQNWCQKYVLK